MEDLKLEEVKWLEELELDTQVEDFVPTEEDFAENEKEFNASFVDEDVRFMQLAVLPNSGPIAKKAAKDAQGSDVLAVREKTGRNDGTYVVTYLKTVKLNQGDPWCQAFIVFRLVKAAQLLNSKIPNSYPRSGYTPTVANWYKSQRLWLPVQDAMKNPSNVQVGDAVYFYFASKKRVAHVGIVVGVTPTGVWTVEGNAQPLSSNVLTPTGWKKMGDIKVGDIVVHPKENTKSTVEAVYPQGVKPVYKVYFNDGRFVECCDEHLWSVEEKGRQHVWNTLQVQEYIEKNKRAVQVPEIDNLNFFNSQDHSINSYLLGTLLGDGGLSHQSIRFTTKDNEILDHLKPLLKDLQIKQEDELNYTFISNSSRNWLRQEVHSMGLNVTSEKKFIPKSYLETSFENRLELLRGLMDTDGHCDKYNRLEYTSVSFKLIKDVQQLVWSLGGRAKIQTKNNIKYTSPSQLTPKESKTAYRIAIILPKGINPFKLSRKANKYNPNRIKQRGNKASPYIVNVEFDRMEECQCIKVSHDDGLYITDNFVVTHNTGPDSGTQVERDGQGVYKKFRPWASIGSKGGFGRNNF